MEELQDYLNKVKEVEDPDSEESCWTNIDYGHEIYDVNKLRGGVDVNNLRLKDKNLQLKEKENEYSIIVNLKSKKDLEYIRDNVLTESVLQAAAKGKEYRITSSAVVVTTPEKITLYEEPSLIFIGVKSPKTPVKGPLEFEPVLENGLLDWLEIFM